MSIFVWYWQCDQKLGLVMSHANRLRNLIQHFLIMSMNLSQKLHVHSRWSWSMQLSREKFTKAVSLSKKIIDFSSHSGFCWDWVLTYFNCHLAIQDKIYSQLKIAHWNDHTEALLLLGEKWLFSWSARQLQKVERRWGDCSDLLEIYHFQGDKSENVWSRIASLAWFLRKYDRIQAFLRMATCGWDIFIWVV